MLIGVMIVFYYGMSLFVGHPSQLTYHCFIDAVEGSDDAVRRLDGQSLQLDASAGLITGPAINNEGRIQSVSNNDAYYAVAWGDPAPDGNGLTNAGDMRIANFGAASVDFTLRLVGDATATGTCLAVEEKRA
jgi:hypothetical protein